MHDSEDSHLSYSIRKQMLRRVNRKYVGPEWGVHWYRLVYQMGGVASAKIQSQTRRCPSWKTSLWSTTLSHPFRAGKARSPINSWIIPKMLSHWSVPSWSFLIQGWAMGRMDELPGIFHDNVSCIFWTLLKCMMWFSDIFHMSQNLWVWSHREARKLRGIWWYMWTVWLLKKGFDCVS
jgi:hypothetical protein